MKSTIIPLNQAGLASFRFPWYGRLKYEVKFFGLKRNPFVSKGAPTVDGWNPVNSAVEVGSWHQNNTEFQKHPRWGRISSIFGTAKQIWNLNSSSDCWLDLEAKLLECVPPCPHITFHRGASWDDCDPVWRIYLILDAARLKLRRPQRIRWGAYRITAPISSPLWPLPTR